jgi:hypothetical protein
MAPRHLSRFEERARRQGIAAASHDLPVTARSLTAPEVRANDSRVALICFSIYLPFALVLTFVPLLSDGMPLWATLAPLLGAIPVGLLAWARANRRGGYRDPGITLTVGENAVAIRDAARSAEIGYGELTVPKVIYYSSNNTVIFLGVELDTPLGRLSLEEGWFRGGTQAAGTILQQLEKRNLPVG